MSNGGDNNGARFTEWLWKRNEIMSRQYLARWQVESYWDSTEWSSWHYLEGSVFFLHPFYFWNLFWWWIICIHSSCLSSSNTGEMFDSFLASSTWPESQNRLTRGYWLQMTSMTYMSTHVCVPAHNDLCTSMSDPREQQASGTTWRSCPKRSPTHTHLPPQKQTSLKLWLQPSLFWLFHSFIHGTKV